MTDPDSDTQAAPTAALAAVESPARLGPDRSLRGTADPATVTAPTGNVQPPRSPTMRPLNLQGPTVTDPTLKVGEGSAETPGRAIVDGLPRYAELRDALREAGFTMAGRRVGLYTRWHFPEANRQRDISLVVPEDPQSPEYAELMLAAISALVLATRQGARAQQALNRLVYWDFYQDIYPAEDR